jgi:chromosome segregation ATPase
MRTLHITTIMFFLILSNINIGFSQCEDKDRVISFLDKGIKDLKNNNKILSDTLIAKDKLIKSLETDKKTLSGEIDNWKQKHTQLEADKKTLSDRVKDYDANLVELENLKNKEAEYSQTIADLKIKVEELDISKARTELKTLKKEHKELSQKFESQTTKVERLQVVDNNYKSLKNKEQKLNGIIANQTTKIDKKTKEVTKLNQQVTQQNNALAEFKGFKDEAIKTIKSEIPQFVVSNKFYDSNDKITDYEKKIAMIKTVVGEDDEDINALAAKLGLFKTTAQTLIAAKAVLDEIYNTKKVNNTINSLEQLNNNSNTHVAKEKGKLLHLLINYCRCYQEAYSLFDGLKVYEGKSGQDRLVSNDIGYFRVYSEPTSQIYIYDEYPFLQKTIIQREKNPINLGITLPNIPCN